MRNFIKNFLLGTLLVGMASCEKDADLTTLETLSFPAPPELSHTSLQLVQEEQTQPALNISWQEVIFPIDAPVDYTVQFTLPADTVGETAWQNAISLNAGTNVFSKSFSALELNQMGTALGLEAEVEGEMVARILAAMDRSIASEAVGVTLTPFTTIITQTEIYLPGTYQDWDPATALSIPTTDVSGIYQGVMSFPAGALDFKVTLDRTWEDNYGDDDRGNLVFDASNNLEVPAPGTYQIRVDLNSMRWSAEAYSWGIVGDATSGGWDVDTDMTFDPAASAWSITTELLPGGLKFRLNDAWTINYGPRNNEDGILYLDDPGAHGIAEAGTYTITLDLNPDDPSTATYTIEKVQ